ncbi:hypothetical protein Cfor_07486, partial [Coptotermes formosanus]
VLARNEAALLERRREEVAEEVKLLKSKVAYLQGLYQEQDELLAGLFGETYGSEEEKHIEVQLDKVRSYRDTLAGGLLEWQEAATLVQSATELLDRAVTCWKEIDSQTPETRFHLSTEARNTIQEAALNVQTAQAMLPGVQFPYCTTREISAVLQVCTAKDVECRGEFVHKFLTAVKIMIEKSLKKDLADVDRKVKEITDRLRKHRVSLIRHKVCECNSY